MASALLASQNEPCWGERKVYMRKYTTNSTASKNPLLKLNPTQKPNPNKQIRNHDSSTHYRFRPGEADRNVAVLENPASPTRKLVDAEESSHGAYVTFNLSAYTRRELKELKKRLISELEQVRILRNMIESKDIQTRPVSAAAELSATRPSPPPPHPLTYAGDLPKANDVTPTPKGKKKKGTGLKRGNPFSSEKDPNPKRLPMERETEKMVVSIMRRCEQILTKLMKHKFGWVFNAPVDAVALGLHDYHRIIKQPMDLGTVKSNIEKGVYQSPLDFASDVRLTFNNAMTYNPKGQDVFFMAEQLLGKFDEMFNPAYKKFQNEQRRILGAIPEDPLLQRQKQQHRAPNRNKLEENTRKVHEPVVIAQKADLVKPTVALSKRMAHPVPPLSAQDEVPHVSESVKARSGKLPKPKAKDPNKRPMSLEEKAKLGMNLQELPPEKMGQLVHILRKRNGHLAQDEDEIELDIEVIDNETLWELDRFVSNYRKMVSKIRRQGLMQSQVSSQTNKSPVSEMADAAQRMRKGEAGEEDVDIGDDIPMVNYPPVEIEKDANAGASSRSSSSGSSSSSSGSSSSSDSDSGSSSRSDSDADSVQSPFVQPKGH